MEYPVSSPRVYRFGHFTLDVRTGELSSNGDKTLLRDQPLQLLLALMETPGELVSREQLIKRLWPNGTFVDFDRGLNKAINHLRDVLGDSADQPTFVETLPRRGYRFVAPVAHDLQEPRGLAVPREERPKRPTPGWWFALGFLALLAVIALTHLVRM
jgi:DNA-binding winged helix-turn-helix (wHTH) protein